VIFIRSHIVLFEERPNININLFKKMFSAIYTQCYAEKDLSNAWIDPLVVKENVLSIIRQFDRVTKIQLVVTPSNPDSGDYKTLDSLFKESKIARGILDLSNKEGLNIDGTFIKDAMNLATTGHGMPKKIYAEKDGQEHLIIPSDEIKRLRVPYSDDAYNFAKTLCQAYVEKLHDGGTP
jgi:hypothetical protein